MARNDEHAPSFPDQHAKLEDERRAAERAAELAERQAVVTPLRSAYSRGGYCSDPNCKVWHPADVSDDPLVAA